MVMVVLFDHMDLGTVPNIREASVLYYIINGHGWAL